MHQSQVVEHSEDGVARLVYGQDDRFTSPGQPGQAERHQRPCCLVKLQKQLVRSEVIELIADSGASIMMCCKDNVN